MRKSIYRYGHKNKEMRKLVLVLLLASIAFGQCGELLNQVETQHYAYLEITSISCDVQATENIYAHLSALAEGYKQAAQCFKEYGDSAKSKAYYAQAGEKYRLAADALCMRDPVLKLKLYIASGDAYKDANQKENAMVSYDLAGSVYTQFSDRVDAALFSEVEQRKFSLENPLEESVARGSSEYFDFMPWAIGGVILMGIVIFIITLGSNK